MNFSCIFSLRKSLAKTQERKRLDVLSHPQVSFIVSFDSSIFLTYFLQIFDYMPPKHHSLICFASFLPMKMTVVFGGQMCGLSVRLSHSAHRNSLAEWPVERREHCDQDMAHSTPPAPTNIHTTGLHIIRPVTAKITSAGVKHVKIHFDLVT